MFYKLLAHGGEAHSGAGESVGHLLESASVAIVFWVALIAACVLVLGVVLGRSKAQILLALAGVHLVYGIFLYDKSPGVGAIVVSVGFAIILMSVIVGLQSHEESTTDNKEK